MSRKYYNEFVRCLNLIKSNKEYQGGKVKKKYPEWGYVYLAKVRGKNLYKIGRARFIARRLKQLQKSNPIRIVMKDYCESGGMADALDLETDLACFCKYPIFSGLST